MDHSVHYDEQVCVDGSTAFNFNISLAFKTRVLDTLDIFIMSLQFFDLLNLKNLKI